MESITGIVESKRKDGKAIKVNGEWYSCFNAGPLAAVEWKDEVTFLAERKGTFLNIKGTVSTTRKGGGGSAPTTGTTGGAYVPKVHSNVGVELGHASKLGMDIAMALTAKEDIGSEAFYKTWVSHTEKVFKVMGALRKSKEEPAKAPVAPPSDDPTTEVIEPF